MVAIVWFVLLTIMVITLFNVRGCKGRDKFEGPSKCFDCEYALPREADLYGNRCLDCEGPKFRYLNETIQAETPVLRGCSHCAIVR